MDEEIKVNKRSNGGLKVRELHGREFFVKIGKLGGQRTRRLVEVGKRALKKQKKR
jgi:hypothetical protein